MSRTRWITSKFYQMYQMGLPSWNNGKESACQCRRCRRCGFNSWVEKITWRRKWQPTPVSCLGNQMEKGAWSVGSQKVRHDWARMHTPNVHRIHTDPLILLKLFQKTEQEGRSIPKNILWSHHYPDTETRQRYHQKQKERKLQVNIYDDYSCKYSQDIIKLQTGRKYLQMMQTAHATTKNKPN